MKSSRTGLPRTWRVKRDEIRGKLGACNSEKTKKLKLHNKRLFIALRKGVGERSIKRAVAIGRLWRSNKKTKGLCFGSSGKKEGKRSLVHSQHQEYK